MGILSRFGLLFIFIVGTSVQGNSGKGYGPGEQEWGHIDVREGAHMFYWLFYVQGPASASKYDKPLVIWLQGGPGGSSTGFGNFEEIGPLYVNGTERPSSWVKYVNLLFIDNPVGAGFSYVDDYKYLTTNNVQIGQDMTTFLQIFYSKYPKFYKTPLYIYCESYGGKMAVEMAKQILAAVDVGKLKANFKGVGLGDSWISPMDSVNTWADFLYQSGLVDSEGRERLNKGARRVQEAMDGNRFLEATKRWSEYEMLIMEETRNVDFYNILYKVKAPSRTRSPFRKRSVVSRGFDDGALAKLMEGPVKKALNIPPHVVYDSQGGIVFASLSGDFMKPVISVVEELLNNTNLQVVVFSGTLDLIVDTPGTVRWVDKMRWWGTENWKRQERKPLYVNGFLEGYVKSVGNLHMYWILRAGHMVPTDNPAAALEVLRLSTEFDKL